MDSHEAALGRGKYEIQRIAEGLRMNHSEAQTAAMPFYRIALQRGFTRGHRTNQVTRARVRARMHDNPQSQTNTHRTACTRAAGSESALEIIGARALVTIKHACGTSAVR